ncbi:MAG: 16S rRNA (guanine(527)-N(7))-methyltransferase RsmG [Dinoroseobacter sp.]|nr:16S rRNA (guanine(527)-N(7))-methyltransferase RsmG [Dinoroseobacter sp.]
MESRVPDLGSGVSRETRERLEIYFDLLCKWNPKINLVAPSTLPDAWFRHFLDSMQLRDLAPDDWQSWVDLGSGGGFPGMVVAILAQSEKTDRSIMLVESDQRKAAFLRTVARETETPVEILAQRIEALGPLSADVVSARALAPLDKLLSYAVRHCRAGGTLLFLKGGRAKSELSDAQKNWQFEVTESPSQTDPAAVILHIKELRRV